MNRAQNQVNCKRRIASTASKHPIGRGHHNQPMACYRHVSGSVALTNAGEMVQNHAKAAVLYHELADAVVEALGLDHVARLVERVADLWPGSIHMPGMAGMAGMAGMQARVWRAAETSEGGTLDCSRTADRTCKRAGSLRRGARERERERERGRGVGERKTPGAQNDLGTWEDCAERASGGGEGGGGSGWCARVCVEGDIFTSLI